MKRIKGALAKFCIGKGIESSVERIEIQAKFLHDSGFCEDEIISAINSLFSETPFFPDASMVLRKLKPSSADYETEAEVITSKILEANKKFGSHDIKGLKEFVGLKGYRIIERFGGWDCIMRLSYDELNTARAQLKRIALSQVKIENSDPKLEYSAREKKNELVKLDFAGLIE